MLAIAESAVLVGLAAHPVRVEVAATRGIPSFEIVGLAEPTVRESRVRVKSALAGLGVDVNEHRITINLAPADLKKRGSAFDVAIALGTLVALGRLPQEAIDGVLLLGELSLNGRLQPLRGVVAHLLGAKGQASTKRVVVPLANAMEAGLVDGVDVELAGTLEELVLSLQGTASLTRPLRCEPDQTNPCHDDLADVRGQECARRALEIAAAGSHDLLMWGPPGAGKTMLARRLPGLLPPMTREEALEVTAIHSIAGLAKTTIIGRRPFRAPHHTASDAALVGGGELVRPGEISLAHNGVLFLDELAEFRRSTLEALRQPLEDGFVSLARARGYSDYPARPLLVAATNPCPCGRYGDGTNACTCGVKVLPYRTKLSGPLLDRIDLHTSLRKVDVLDLQSPRIGEPSEVVRARVVRAREVQKARRKSGEVRAITNARLTQKEVERVCALDAKGLSILADAVRKHDLSARAYSKVLRIARTIADLAGATSISADHVGEAVGYRMPFAWQSEPTSNGLTPLETPKKRTAESVASS